MSTRNYKPPSPPGPARGWFLRLARQRQSFHFALFGNAHESSRRPVKPVRGGKS